MKFMEKVGLVVLLITVLIAVLGLAQFPIFIKFICIVAASVGSAMLLFPD